MQLPPPCTNASISYSYSVTPERVVNTLPLGQGKQCDFLHPPRPVGCPQSKVPIGSKASIPQTQGHYLMRLGEGISLWVGGLASSVLTYQLSLFPPLVIC